jgi:hypothetical protein
MKGRHYVPYVGKETHLDWHWNDGIYTYGNRKDIDESQLKPWENDPTAPVLYRKVVYNWRTSVPKEWYRLKSPDRFKHVKEMNLHSNTLEFLGETQKYIHLICHPPQIQEHLANRVIGRAESFNQIRRPSPPTTSDSPVPKIEESTRLARHLSRKKASRHHSPVMTKEAEQNRIPDLKIIKSRTEETLQASSQYSSSQAVLPRPFTTSKKQKVSAHVKKNSSIQAFLDRFDTKPQGLTLQAAGRGSTPAKLPSKKQSMLALCQSQRRQRPQKVAIGLSLQASISSRQLEGLKKKSFQRYRRRKLEEQFQSEMTETLGYLVD